MKDWDDIRNKKYIYKGICKLDKKNYQGIDKIVVMKVKIQKLNQLKHLCRLPRKIIEGITGGKA